VTYEYWYVDLGRPARGRIRVSQRSLERQLRQLAAPPATAAAGPAAATRMVRYRCQDGRDVVASFAETVPPSALVERDGARWRLPLRRSASGARYSDGNVTLWEHQGEARFEIPGRAVICRRQPSS